MKSIHKYSAWLAGALFYAAPIIVFAQAVTDAASLIVRLKDILNLVIPFLIGLAFVVFLWGVFKYVTTASLDAKAGAKETIIYGLIGLFIMLSAWGLVNILIVTFFTSSGPTAIPPFPPPKVPGT